MHIFKLGGYRNSKQYIKIYKIFNSDGLVLESKPAIVCTLQNVEAVREVLLRSPLKSIRKAAAELGISRRSVQRILKKRYAFLSIQNNSDA